MEKTEVKIVRRPRYKKYMRIPAVVFLCVLGVAYLVVGLIIFGAVWLAVCFNTALLIVFIILIKHAFSKNSGD